MINRAAALASLLALAGCGSDEAKTVVAPPPSLSQTTAYDCNGIGRVTAITNESDNSVQLGMPGGKSLKLLSVPAASGARYVDSANNEFWSKGSDAMLTTGGKTSSCTPPAP